jgi:hypothetical protein
MPDPRPAALQPSSHADGGSCVTVAVRSLECADARYTIVFALFAAQESPDSGEDNAADPCLS